MIKYPIPQGMNKNLEKGGNNFLSFNLLCLKDLLKGNEIVLYR
jgi:hypothetical protein